MNKTLPDPEIDLGPLDGYLAFHLRMAQDAVVRAFFARYSEPIFRAGRFTTLMVIRLNPGLSQVDVCRATGRDKSTVSPLITAMESEGLILRRPSPKDRRSVTLHLTPAGETALDALLPLVDAHNKRLADIVGPTTSELIEILKKLTQALS